jgi:hypothetical protein
MSMAVLVTVLCPSCFGAAEGPMIDAARLGAIALIGVVVAVQAAFVAFFLHLRKQARRAAQSSEFSRYQRKRADHRMLEAR